RLAVVGGDHHREGVRAAGPRADAARRDLRAELSRRPGERARDRGDVRARQHDGRPRLRAGRPEDPARMKLSPSARVGFVMLAVFVTAGIAGPWLAPYDPAHIDLGARFSGPSAAHWLGTDSKGVDALSQLLWGARSALIVSIAVVSISSTIGIALGTI